MLTTGIMSAESTTHLHNGCHAVGLPNLHNDCQAVAGLYLSDFSEDKLAILVSM